MAERPPAANEARMPGNVEAMLVQAGVAEAARGDRETARMEPGNDGGDGVRNLPSSFGKSFATLDDYLEHLARYAGPVDLPWYREIRPGLFELVTTMRPAPAPKTSTREQLMREYGFSR